MNVKRFKVLVKFFLFFDVNVFEVLIVENDDVFFGDEES